MAERDCDSFGLARSLWPLLLTAFVAALPMTATSLFIAAIATDLQTTAATVGALRGLGGVAALVVGFATAPLIDRVPRALTVAVGLLLVAVANVSATIGQLSGLVVFYVVLGATTAVLAPAVQAASADRAHGSAAGRATSLVNAAQTLSGIAGGPLLAAASFLAGWQGAFLALGGAAASLGLLCALVLDRRPPPAVARASYRESFAIVARAPGAVPLLLASTLRSCAWFAWLTYLAAFFTECFGASTGTVAWVWFLGATAFCLANLAVGRAANPAEGQSEGGWRSPARLLAISSIANIALAPLVFVSPTVPLALAATVALCIAMGASLASLLSLLIRRYADVRGAVMGLNAVGLNVGTIAGATVAGVSLGVGGYPALAVTLLAMAAAAAAAMLLALRSLGAAGDVEHLAPVPA